MLCVYSHQASNKSEHDSIYSTTRRLGKEPYLQTSAASLEGPRQLWYVIKTPQANWTSIASADFSVFWLTALVAGYLVVMFSLDFIHLTCFVTGRIPDISKNLLSAEQFLRCSLQGKNISPNSSHCDLDARNRATRKSWQIYIQIIPNQGQSLRFFLLARSSLFFCTIPSGNCFKKVRSTLIHTTNLQF